MNQTLGFIVLYSVLYVHVHLHMCRMAKLQYL